MEPSTKQDTGFFQQGAPIVKQHSGELYLCPPAKAQRRLQGLTLRPGEVRSLFRFTRASFTHENGKSSGLRL